MSPDFLTAETIPTRYSSEDAAVLLTVQILLDFVAHHNFDKVKPVIYSQGGTARLRQNGMQWGSIEDVCKQILTLPTNMEEYMYDPEVRIAGNLAMVWTRCHIYIDGKLASEATNCISLHKENEVWKISSISDTASKNLTQ
ncbi:hypothetical protein F5884DRAFT_802086 [Xylogone sp. PMI_703]|nr:hypothetical protein F5884DRAFT_802086 [Xylogone sp. PMI_703]